MKKTKTIETRGAKPKYNFSIKVGETIDFPSKNATRVRSAINAYISRKKLNWNIKTWTVEKKIYLKRIK